MFNKYLTNKVDDLNNDIHSIERKLQVLKDRLETFSKDELLNCVLANAYRTAIAKRKECSKIILKAKKVKHRKDFVFRGGPSSYEYPEGLTLSVIDEGCNRFAYVADYRGYLFPRSIAKELFDLAVLVDKEVGYDK